MTSFIPTNMIKDRFLNCVIVQIVHIPYNNHMTSKLVDVPDGWKHDSLMNKDPSFFNQCNI